MKQISPGLKLSTKTTQARVPRRDGAREAVERTGADHRAAMAQEQDRAAAVPQSANVVAINVAGRLLYGDEEVAFGYSGYRGVDRRPEAQFIAMMPSKRRTLNPFLYPDMVTKCAEKMKAGIRAKVEHPFRVLKRQFEYTKARYRGLAKNTARIVTLFAVSNL